MKQYSLRNQVQKKPQSLDPGIFEESEEGKSEEEYDSEQSSIAEMSLSSLIKEQTQPKNKKDTQPVVERQIYTQFPIISDNYSKNWKDIKDEVSKYVKKRDLKRVRGAYRMQKKRYQKKQLEHQTIEEYEDLLRKDLNPTMKKKMKSSMNTHLGSQEALNVIKNRIDEFAHTIHSLTNYQDIILQLDNIQDYSKLKAVLTLGNKLKKQLKDDGLKLGYFQNIVAPVLYYFPRLKFIEQPEAKFLHDISSSFDLSSLSLDEALNYSLVLQQHNLFNLTTMWQCFHKQENLFWTQLLTQTCNIEKTVAEYWLKKADKFMRNEVFEFTMQYGITLEFCQIVNKFSRFITKEELFKLYMLSNKHNFSILIGFLPIDSNTSFSNFQINASPYLDNQQEGYRDQLKTLLKKKPLHEWNKYESAIDCYSSFSKSSLSLIQGVFKKHIKLGQLLQPSLLGRDTSQRLKFSLQMINEKHPIAKFDWQLQLVDLLHESIIVQKKTKILSQLGTGHGKSVIIQLLALSLHQTEKKHVLVVCLNDFLASQGRIKYNTDSHIEYISINQFLYYPPSQNVLVIFDEIDQMIGKNSLEVMKEQDEERTIKLIYKPEFFKEWGSVIAFSGTVSDMISTQFSIDFPQSLILKFPCLRETGENFTLRRVMRASDHLYRQVVEYLKEVSDEFKNVIIIFESLIQLKDFLNQLNKSHFSGKSINVFDNFSNDFVKTVVQMDNLLKDQWVVLTTKEGCRGTDFKGKSPAHVILLYQPDSLGDCIQALGRGSRNLDQVCSGTIICSSPLSDICNSYLKVLEIQDDELKAQRLLNLKVSRLLHGKTIKSEKDFETWKLFEQHLYLDRDFKLMNDFGTRELWKQLRELIGDQFLPTNPFGYFEHSKQEVEEQKSSFL